MHLYIFHRVGRYHDVEVDLKHMFIASVERSLAWLLRFERRIFRKNIFTKICNQNSKLQFVTGWMKKVRK